MTLFSIIHYVSLYTLISYLHCTNKSVKKLTTVFGGGHSFHFDKCVGAPQGIPLGNTGCCSSFLGEVDASPFIVSQHKLFKSLGQIYLDF